MHVISREKYIACLAVIIDNIYVEFNNRAFIWQSMRVYLGYYYFFKASNVFRSINEQERLSKESVIKF